jgi:hypothetical protein
MSLAEHRRQPAAPRQAISEHPADGALRDYVNWLFAARLADRRQSAPAAPQARAEATAAARAWLETLDRGDYAGGLERAALIIQRALTKEQWDRAVRAARAPLGPCLARRLGSIQFVASPPCGPGGPYVLIQFESDFRGRTNVTETIAAAIGSDGRWRVAGYVVA